MTLGLTHDGVSIAGTTYIGSLGLTSNADSSVAFGGILVDDESGALSLTVWRPVAVTESACSQPRLFTGYMSQQVISRGGDSEGDQTSAARVWDCTLADQNTVLGLRLITGTDGKRPAETHLERIDWLLGSSYLSGLIADYGLVDRTQGFNYEAADYRGQYAFDVLNDVAGPVGRTFFAYWDPVYQAVGLFFDTPDSSTFTSSLTISNVAADIDNVTCFGPQNAQMTRDPSEIYSLVRLTYAHGTRTVSDGATASTYISRGLQVDNTRIGASDTALRSAQRIQDKDSTPRDTIACTITVPKSKVGFIDSGNRVRVKFSHLPGYSSWIYTRVTRRTIRPSGTLDNYDIDLELSNHAIGSSGGGGAPGPGDFPNPPPQSPVHFYSGSLVFLSDGYGGGPGGSVTLPGTNTTQSSTNTAIVTFSAGVTYNFSFEIDQTGGDNPPQVGLVDNNTHNWIQALDVASGSIPHSTGVGSGIYTYSGSFVLTADFVGFFTASTGALGHTPKSTPASWTIDPDGWDTGADTPIPKPAQWVRSETPTLNTDGPPTTYRTSFPFADGSLVVYVDRTDQTAAITSYDGACGDFTLGFAPKTGELVEVDYQGR